MSVDLKQKIYIAGHKGMVGSAIVRELQRNGYTNLVYRTHNELDLTNQAAVKHFFESEKPDQVYLAAAKVGGIYANNTYPADFIYDNLMVQTNVIHQAFKGGVKKLLFLGSSCIYPKLAPQPMTEDALLTGRLEPTNEPYAVAKIAGIKMCESYNRQYGQSHGVDYRSVMPTNLYGPGDNYHPENSHVIPGLIVRFHEAKINNESVVNVWGSGKPRREFLHVDDMAKASIFVMKFDKKRFSNNCIEMPINIGSGYDISIKDLATLISEVVGFRGKIIFDLSKPDGALQKQLNSKLINNLGWNPKIHLADGVFKAYAEYKNQSAVNKS
jgi:GDP-L-fucose synthase